MCCIARSTALARLSWNARMPRSSSVTSGRSLFMRDITSCNGSSTPGPASLRNECRARRAAAGGADDGLEWSGCVIGPSACDRRGRREEEGSAWSSRRSSPSGAACATSTASSTCPTRTSARCSRPRSPHRPPATSSRGASRSCARSRRASGSPRRCTSAGRPSAPVVIVVSVDPRPCCRALRRSRRAALRDPGHRGRGREHPARCGRPRSGVVLDRRVRRRRGPRGARHRRARSSRSRSCRSATRRSPPAARLAVLSPRSRPGSRGGRRARPWLHDARRDPVAHRRLPPLPARRHAHARSCSAWAIRTRA